MSGEWLWDSWPCLQGCPKLTVNNASHPLTEFDCKALSKWCKIFITATNRTWLPEESHLNSDYFSSWVVCYFVRNYTVAVAGTWMELEQWYLGKPDYHGISVHAFCRPPRCLKSQTFIWRCGFISFSPSGNWYILRRLQLVYHVKLILLHENWSANISESSWNSETLEMNTKLNSSTSS